MFEASEKFQGAAAGVVKIEKAIGRRGE